MIPSRRRLVPACRRSVAVLAVALLATVSACGSTKDEKAEPTPSPSAPTPSVEVPEGVSLTDHGAKLAFGDTATVAYRPNEKRGSVLDLTVMSVTRARMADFAGYVLDDRTKASTPYYVRVKVTNVGTGNVGGTDIPLWAVDRNNTLIHSSSFTNTYRRCPSAALPAQFAPRATASTCLVYLVPDHGQLTAVSFRPEQAFAPIVWTGTIATEKAKPAKKAGKNGTKKGAKKP